MKITNVDFLKNGIFGILTTDTGEFLCYTLQHAYQFSPEILLYHPKVPIGTYTCVRGIHKLHPDSQEFETFEVMDVPGHTGILFHCGNTNADSDGCILLGINQIKGSEILKSKLAFQQFMKYLEGVNSFNLTIT